ncbi:hypothetical protein [Bordetella sp. 2513F-2]
MLEPPCGGGCRFYEDGVVAPPPGVVEPPPGVVPGAVSDGVLGLEGAGVVGAGELGAAGAGSVVDGVVLSAGASASSLLLHAVRATASMEARISDLLIMARLLFD